MRNGIGLGSLRADRAEFPAIEREFVSQRLDAALDCGEIFLRCRFTEYLGDARRYFGHLRFAESTSGDGRTAYADAAWVQRRIHIERDAVLVDGDVSLVECEFSFFPTHALRENINEDQM